MPKLANQESRGFTHAFKVSAADLNTSGYLTSTQKIVASIPAGGIVTGCALVNNTPFAGTSTDVTFAVGTLSGTATEFLAATDVDSSSFKAAFNTGTVLVNTAAGYSINNSASAVPVYLKVGGTISAAGVAAGDWLVLLTILDPALIASNA
jgi:hypothetical protein